MESKKNKVYDIEREALEEIYWDNPFKCYLKIMVLRFRRLFKKKYTIKHPRSLIAYKWAGEKSDDIVEVTDQVDIVSRTERRKKYIRDDQCRTVIDPTINLGNESYFKQWEDGEISEEEFIAKSKMNISLVKILYKRMGRIDAFEKARGKNIRVE